MTLDELGKKLDEMGWTLVNMGDPVTGDPLAALDWEQVSGLVQNFEDAIKSHRLAREALRDRNTALRKVNLEAGEAISRLWVRILGSEKPETDSASGLADRILEKLDEEQPESPGVTDDMVERFISVAFSPNVVVDRSMVRNGLAFALQTR